MIIFTYIGMATVGIITLVLVLWSLGVIKFDTKIEPIQKPNDDNKDD